MARGKGRRGEGRVPGRSDGMGKTGASKASNCAGKEGNSGRGTEVSPPPPSHSHPCSDVAPAADAGGRGGLPARWGGSEGDRSWAWEGMGGGGGGRLRVSECGVRDGTCRVSRATHYTPHRNAIRGVVRGRRYTRPSAADQRTAAHPTTHRAVRATQRTTAQRRTAAFGARRHRQRRRRG